MSRLKADVVVVGGGVVGVATALGFSQLGKQVVLVESTNLLEWHGDEQHDLRVFALSLASEQFLKSLDAWDCIQSKRVCRYDNMFVWDQVGDGEIHFHAEDVDHFHLGHIVENKVIVASLMEKVAEKESIQVLTNEKVESVIQDQYGARLTTEVGTQIDSGFVVAADGGNSTVRGLLGMTAYQSSYEQQGIVAEVETQLSHQNTAWQCFTPSGPVAFLPLSNGNCSIVWSVKNEEANALLTSSDEVFNDELAKASQFKLGDIKVKSKRVSFPLSKLHADTYLKDNVVLVGDAAHVIHPLAGQGVNLGLMDAATLLEELAHKPRPFPAKAALRRYERRRKHSNYLVQTAMDGFHYGFMQGDDLVKAVRNRGLNISNRYDQITQRFARFAAGLEGDVPLEAKLKR